MSAREIWSKDSAFSERQTDFVSNPLFSTATLQIENLLQSRSIGRIVEVGSGSGRYLAYLGKLTGVPVIGSDIASPRLDLARQEHPSIDFIEADANEIARRYRSDDTLFLAMNVLGNLSPAEVSGFFADVGPAVTFCARGLLTGDAEPRSSGIGWDHNYNTLLKGFEVMEMRSDPLPKYPDRLAIIATAVRS